MLPYQTVNSFYNTRSTSVLLTPNIVDRSNSLSKAIKILNHKAPMEPPTTYFIRRNNDYLNKYKDGEQFKKLMQIAPRSLKNNFDYFKVTKTDKI